MKKRCLLTVFFGLSMVALFCPGAAGQSQTSDTETQVWPEVDLHLQLPSHLRILAFSGLEQGIDYSLPTMVCGRGTGLSVQAHLERTRIKY